MLFIVAAASTSAALMTLLAEKSGWTMRGLQDLRRMDAWLIVLELIVLIAVVVSLGQVIRAWLNVWGLLLLSVIGLGMLVPLALYWQSGERRDHKITTTAVLVLAGGFILRLVIVFSAQGV